MKNLKYATETTVEKILAYNESDLTQELKDYQKLNPDITSRYASKIQKISDFIHYLSEAKEIIKNNKLKPKQRIGISFIPQSLTRTSKQNLNQSKIGGIPFCFLTEEILPLLKDRNKFLDYIEKIYPKCRYGTFLNFIGDIDSISPSFFMSQMMGQIKDDRKNINLFSRNNYEDFPSNAFGSFFIDQNFSSMSSQDATGVFISLKYQNLYDFTQEQVRDYTVLMTDFMNSKVTKSFYAMDKIDLQNINNWSVQLEVLEDSKNLFFQSYSNQPNSGSNIKLFGYPDSQQSIYPYYCTNGLFGPRLLSPFLSLQNNQVDTTIQIYADFLDVNYTQESRCYLKVNISST